MLTDARFFLFSLLLAFILSSCAGNVAALPPING
jgi:hypothetical protein